MRVLICGGGVIGASIAYFLSCRGVQAIVIERTGLACAASGKSGGFLALDWCDGTPLEALARRSFALHAELAERIGGDWGYRRLTTYGGLVSAQTRPGGRAHDDRLGFGSRHDHPASWARHETTAQVHPGQFTAALMRAAEAQGAELRIGRSHGRAARPERRVVTGVERRRRDRRGRRGGDRHGPVVDPGCAMAAAARRCSATRATASCSRPGRRCRPRRCFSNTGRRAARSCRPRCSRAPTARPTSAPSPARARCRSIPPRSRPTRARIERLAGDVPADSRRRWPRRQVLARQACFRPVTEDGLPLIGPVAGRRRRLRRDRPQRLGHPQRAGDRRGDGRADPRR